MTIADVTAGTCFERSALVSRHFTRAALLPVVRLSRCECFLDLRFKCLAFPICLRSAADV